MPAHIHIFKKYVNQTLVETGSFKGEGIFAALMAGFQEVRSIEIYNEHFKDCSEKFRNEIAMRRVKMVLGSSTDKLSEVLSDIDYPVTFWLDGHWSGPGTPSIEGKHTPVMDELEVIKAHQVKNHTILVDDMRCCGTEYFDYLTREDIENKIREINPNYQISYEDSNEPRDILVARIP